MKTDLLTIGRFAQLTELTVRALRFYDELGVLCPQHVDQDSGYRYYATDQLARAELIARLRRTTMPLEEIRKFMECPDSDRTPMLDAQRTLLRDRAAATTDAMRVLDHLAGQLREPAVPPTVSATPMVGKTLWDQEVLCIRAEWTEQDVKDYSLIHDPADGVAVVLPTCDLVADKGFIEEVYEAVDRQGLNAVAPPYLASSEPDADGVWRTEVGWPVDRPGESDGRVEPGVLPGSDVASTLYTGRFEEIAFAYRHLWTEIIAAGFTPIGNPREIYATKPEFVVGPDDYCTEVVWPIKR